MRDGTPTTTWRQVRGLVALLLALAVPVCLAAQSVSVSVLKAEFLVRFAKFTDWPADTLPDNAPLVFCVFDAAVAGALSTSAAGQSVGSHPVVVTQVAVDAPLAGCGLLYVSGLDSRRSLQLMTTLRGASVLSVGDDEEFTQQGGVIRFFVEDGHMRFAVNVQAAERARLRISAQMLTLAKIVKD